MLAAVVPVSDAMVAKEVSVRPTFFYKLIYEIFLEILEANGGGGIKLRINSKISLRQSNKSIFVTENTCKSDIF